MISSALSRLSAVVLLLCGLALLFGSDTLLPALAAGFPPAAAWLGQLLAAAWLGVAAMNWLHRSALLGGIYGRPLVLGNLSLYFISALSLLRALLDRAAPPALWAAFVLAGAMLTRVPSRRPRKHCHGRRPTITPRHDRRV
jgi:hypothetical protein